MTDELKKAQADARRWQSKSARQSQENAKLLRQIEALRSDKAKLLADLKWMRGEAA